MLENNNNEEMFPFEKKFIPVTMSDDFDGFLTKANNNAGGFGGIFSVADKESFFKTVSYDNALRRLCTVLRTNSESLEMPAFDVHYGLNGQADYNSQTHSVTLKLVEEYAKLEISRNLFAKINSYAEYLKGVLASRLSMLERKEFISGANGIVKQIINALPAPANNAPRALKQEDDIEKALFDLKFSLEAAYIKNGVFLMSRDALRKISEKKDAQGRYLFDGVDKLLGHHVEIMDELNDAPAQNGDKFSTLIFADFKQAVVIAERESNIEQHSGYDKPNMIGLSMPVAAGIAIVNNQAIVACKTKI